MIGINMSGREEKSLIDMFVLELLVNYVYSLRMAHKDDKSLGTQEQCKQVISHLERMIKVKSDLLLKANKDRRKPRSVVLTPDGIVSILCPAEDFVKPTLDTSLNGCCHNVVDLKQKQGMSA